MRLGGDEGRPRLVVAAELVEQARLVEQGGRGDVRPGAVDQAERLLRLVGIGEIGGAQQGEVLTGAAAGGFGLVEPQPRLGHVAARLINPRQVRHDDRHFGYGAMRLNQQRLGLVEAALIVKAKRQVDEDLRVRAGEGQGAAIMELRRRQVVFFPKDDSQLQMRLRIVGACQQGFARRGLRCLGLARGVQHQGQVVIEIGCGIDAQGSAIGGLGTPDIATAMQGDGLEFQRLQVVGRFLEAHFTQADGADQVAGLEGLTAALNERMKGFGHRLRVWMR